MRESPRRSTSAARGRADAGGRRRTRAPEPLPNVARRVYRARTSRARRPRFPSQSTYYFDVGESRRRTPAPNNTRQRGDEPDHGFSRAAASTQERRSLPTASRLPPRTSSGSAGRDRCSQAKAAVRDSANPGSAVAQAWSFGHAKGPDRPQDLEDPENMLRR